MCRDTQTSTWLIIKESLKSFRSSSSMDFTYLRWRLHYRGVGAVCGRGGWKWSSTIVWRFTVKGTGSIYNPEWRATKMRFLTACWPNTFCLSERFELLAKRFEFWAQNEEKHTLENFQKGGTFQQLFIHVMVWPMIQLTGLVLDHFEAYP